MNNLARSTIRQYRGELLAVKSRAARQRTGLETGATKGNRNKAFTLVEILIVVVILGILAAIVTALFNTTVDDAARQATASELSKLRRHIEVYKIRNNQNLPSVTEGDGQIGWGQLVGPENFESPPVNAWVGGANARVIVFGDAADTGYQRDYGWIYNPENGDVWAGGFDDHDNAIPKSIAAVPPSGGG